MILSFKCLSSFGLTTLRAFYDSMHKYFKMRFNFSGSATCPSTHWQSWSCPLRAVPCGLVQLHSTPNRLSPAPSSLSPAAHWGIVREQLSQGPCENTLCPLPPLLHNSTKAAIQPDSPPLPQFYTGPTPGVAAPAWNWSSTIVFLIGWIVRWTGHGVSHHPLKVVLCPPLVEVRSQRLIQL